MKTANYKTGIAALPKRMRDLVNTSVDDAKSSAFHLTVDCIPDLRALVMFLERFPTDQTSKLLMLKRVLRQLERAADQ